MLSIILLIKINLDTMYLPTYNISVKITNIKIIILTITHFEIKYKYC